MDQLTKDEEELVWADGPCVRSSSPYLESLKWNPQPTDHRQSAHDLLDVGIGEVMLEVDKARCLVTGRLRQQGAMNPSRC